MNEEINEALKIIKEPITVNSIEYKYFNQENYEKLLSVYENSKRFVLNWEQALQNIKDLQKEIERLNNIIKGIESYCNMTISMNFNMNNSKLQEQIVEDYTNVLNKLKELKDNKK